MKRYRYLIITMATVSAIIFLLVFWSIEQSKIPLESERELQVRHLDEQVIDEPQEISFKKIDAKNLEEKIDEQQDHALIFESNEHVSVQSIGESQQDEIERDDGQILDKEKTSEDFLDKKQEEIYESPELRGNEHFSELIYIALVMLAITTLVSTAINFYLYRWRKVLLSSPQLLVPEELGKYLDKLTKSLNGIGNILTNEVRSLTLKTAESSERIGNMTETYMTLQTALDEKDQLIRRLKRGYDAEIFRKFITRFIRIDQAINDYMVCGESDRNAWEQVKRLFEDALDECGVESYEPQLGVDYRQEDGLSDNPKKIITDDLTKDFTVAEVIESGYRIRFNNQQEIIKPAKVTIYIYEEQVS